MKKHLPANYPLFHQIKVLITCDAGVVNSVLSINSKHTSEKKKHNLLMCWLFQKKLLLVSPRFTVFKSYSHYWIGGENEILFFFNTISRIYKFSRPPKHRFVNSASKMQNLVNWVAMCGSFHTRPFIHLESLWVSGKLPTFPSPKPTLTLTSHLGQNVGLGEG